MKQSSKHGVRAGMALFAAIIAVVLWLPSVVLAAPSREVGVKSNATKWEQVEWDEVPSDTPLNSTECPHLLTVPSQVLGKS